MDIISILKQDYQKFPADQTYSIYAKNVYFEDPLNKFRGIDCYQKMIGFMKSWFNDIQLDLHDISRSGDLIKTRWTLSWTAPVPWKPRMEIPGWSELKLNTDGLINSHIDYWDISRLDVLKQVFLVGNR
ncbi:MAG: DUF2358 domain-containing protein [Okeania sp. SIO3H1]|uniref:DUF2358 domain-containing protein n=1 Tax=Okeania sp. SIO1I7 TaxID=2607772 RepID=UPI0013C5ACA5|nr:DUF2358 domain-containing protein [Okeania sp. SIO1I7]NEN89146.1 DUF2358 domain-containing protein [Okeania sp. SIO3H1]NET24236.1 DUF2358 domain-containing protein [Okeania sp. SIO1I7]